jgi:hypothetical protein
MTWTAENGDDGMAGHGKTLGNGATISWRPLSFRSFPIASFAKNDSFEFRVGWLWRIWTCHSISKSFVPRRRAVDSAVARQGEVDKGTGDLEMESNFKRAERR